MIKSKYWLMKSEPLSYSIEDLQRDGFTTWDGVRNYQVRNMIRDQMRPGDLAIFYHSNAKPPGAAGLCRICGSPEPDASQWDPTSPYFDKKVKPGMPIWLTVEIEFVEKFSRMISLEELKSNHQLKNLLILKKGNRLSVTPLQEEEFFVICQLARQDTLTTSHLQH